MSEKLTLGPSSKKTHSTLRRFRKGPPFLRQSPATSILVSKFYGHKP
jgi:hypothetical protein